MKISCTSYSTDLQIQCSHCSTDPVPVVTIDEEANNEPPSKKRKLSITVTLKKSLWVRNSVMLILTWPKDYLGYSSLIGWLTIYSVTTKKAPIPERKEKMLQIVHSGSCHHWIVATTIGNKRDAGEVLVYDFIFKNVDRETRKNICNIFQLLPISNVKVVKTLKQIGTKDCGLFAITYATALALGQDPSKLSFHQESMWSHFVACLEQDKLMPFP